MYVPQKKRGVKHIYKVSSFKRSTTVKGTNIAFHKVGLPLPWELLLPKLVWILRSLSDLEVSNTMLFYFIPAWGMGCTNDRPCVDIVVGLTLASS